MIRKKIRKKLSRKSEMAEVAFSQRGETLLELVLSIGLFAITMLMLATMFASASRISVNNFASEQAIDDRVTALVTNDGVGEKIERITFSGVREVSQNIKLVEKDKLYKFSIVD